MKKNKHSKNKESFVPPDDIRNDPEALSAFYRQKIEELQEQAQQLDAERQKLKAELASRRANEIALEVYHDLNEKYNTLCKTNKK